MKLPNPETLIKKFILLAYADVFNKRSYDFVGTSDRRDELVVYSCDSATESFKKSFFYDHNEKIYAIMPGNFSGSGVTDFLIVSKKGDNHFSNIVLRKDTKKSIKLPDSESPSFIYTDNENLRTSILLQTNKGLISVSLDENYNDSKKTVSWLKNNERIANDHTSTFVDLSGDLKADLVLVIIKNGKKYLKVMKNSKEGFENFFEMELPLNIGPLIFYDLKNKGTNDLIFISEEDGTFYLNIYFNSNELYIKSDEHFENFGSEIFVETEELRKKINFRDLVSNATPILKNDDIDNVPCGIFARDIDLDGNLDLFISVNKDGGRKVVLLNYDPKIREFVLNANLSEFSEIDNIISISTSDIQNKGKEDFIINAKKDGETTIFKITNELGLENSKTSITTCLDISKKHPYGLGVPGTAYIVVYDSKRKMTLASNIPPGPFLHLSNQAALVGLGSSSFVINSLRTMVPAYDKFEKSYYIGHEIIQNLDLIIYIKHNSVKRVEAFFITSRHFKTIVYVLITVFAVNLFVIIFLHVRQKSKENAAKRTDRMNPLFRSL